jgi:hypothetical protein
MESKKLYFLFGFALILLVCYFIFRIHPWNLQNEEILQSKKTSVETNGFVLSRDSFLVASKYSKLVIATTDSYQKNSTTNLFVARQESNSIIEFRQMKLGKEEVLKKIDSYNLEDLFESNKDSASFYIFDLLMDHSSLLVSFVRIPNNNRDCNEFRIVSIPYNGVRLSLRDSQYIWRAPICLKTYPNNPGWTAFHGKLAVSSNQVFISVGMFIAETYLGIFPNRNVRGIGKNLFSEIERLKIFGKVIMINRENGKTTSFISGLRAPSGLYIRSESPTTLWVTDHGPRGGDELNIGLYGEDYGWPRVSLGEKYFSDVELNNGESRIQTSFLNHSGFKPPAFSWTPSIAPSNVIVLKSDYGPRKSWKKSDLLIGSLKATSLFHITVDNREIVRSVEQINVGDRIRDLSEQNQQLWYSTDDGQVVLLRDLGIEKEEGMFPKPEIPDHSFVSNVPIISEILSFIDRVARKIIDLF